MAKRLSSKTKAIRRMGMGTERDYKPYITTSEFNSVGTTSVVRDWKTGRGVHCLSQGEMYLFYILRWDDTNIDIREQCPLDYDETIKISNEMGFSKPKDTMTTDMLVTKEDGSYVAYSVKADRNLTRRQLQLLCVEKRYWLNHGADYHLVFKSDLNAILVSNIRLVTEFYDEKLVFDKMSAIKHKIAIKEYKVDMEHEILDEKILTRLLEEQ